MAKDLLHSISEGMSGFSKGQKLIARYIIENYDKAAFMTASKLGNTVGVSESTVVRFATEVGFEGYPPAAEGPAGADPQPPDLRCSAWRSPASRWASMPCLSARC